MILHYIANRFGNRMIPIKTVDDEPMIKTDAVINQLRYPEQMMIQFLYGNQTFPAGNPVNAFGNTATGTRRKDPCEIAGAVSDQRHGITSNGGEHQLSVLSVRQNFTLFIDDFRDDMVFPQMHSFKGFTGHCAPKSALPAAILSQTILNPAQVVPDLNDCFLLHR